MLIECHLLQNNNVNCSDEVYNNIGAWRKNKNYVDSQIKALKEKLGELKVRNLIRLLLKLSWLLPRTTQMYYNVVTFVCL